MRKICWLLTFMLCFLFSSCGIDGFLRTYKSSWVKWDIEWDDVRQDTAEIFRIDKKARPYKNGPKYCRKGYCSAETWALWQTEEYLNWLREWNKMSSSNRLYINHWKFRFGKQRIYFTYNNHPEVIDTIIVKRCFEHCEGKIFPESYLCFIWRNQKVTNGMAFTGIKHYSDTAKTEMLIGEQ